jgi:hypothetical protein
MKPMSGKVLDALDGATALGLLAAVMYFGGYIYYASYYRALGVPPELFKRSSDDYIIASWGAVPWLLLLYLVVAVLKAAVVDLVSKKWRDKIHGSFIKNIPRVFFVMLWIALISIILGVFEMVAKRGANDAVIQKNKRREIIVSKDGVSSTYLYLGFGDGRLILGEKTQNGIERLRIVSTDQFDEIIIDMERVGEAVPKVIAVTSPAAQ